MPDTVAVYSIADHIAELAANPDSTRWALQCCWVPGTGYCRDRFCSIECLFRAQREAEAERIMRTRQRRRRGQSTSAGRLARY